MLNQERLLYLSRVFHEIVWAYNNGYRYIINQGGTSSTKTFSDLQFLVRFTDVADIKVDVVGQSVPQLKDGVLDDMPAVCDGFGINFHNNYNKSDKIFKNRSGHINFKSIDKLGKAHGGRRDILFMNEANYIPYPIAKQLMLRTRDLILIDFNPTARFWAHDILDKHPDTAYLIKSTYKDNKMLEQSIIDEIESNKDNENFWRVYGLGEIGYSEGLVLPNFEVKEFDKESFSQYRHGVDWGFSVDPFAYIRLTIDKKKKEIHICDEIYATELLNEQSARMVKKFAGYEPVGCDSAEPKSVAEFRTHGVNAYGAKKGQGSIEYGIKFLQSFKIIIHPSCPNVIKEFETHRYLEDKKSGGFLAKTEDKNNHAIDGIRYALANDMEFVKNFIQAR